MLTGRRECTGEFFWGAARKRPVWKPLLAVMGRRLTSGFMWMGTNKLADESNLHAYKHIYTRDWIYLTDDLRAFEETPCGLMAPLRLDFAIKRVLCDWWILSGWEEKDRAAVVDAVHRAQRRLFDE